jgi:hypothetical protein
MSRLTLRDVARLHALHCLARVVLRVRPPLRAKELVDRIASQLPSLSGVENARDAVRTLFPTGSCLTRAVTIAAAMPGAEVVIGVDVWSSARLSAHAWLEIDGTRVDTSPDSAPLPEELTRFPSRSPSSLGREAIP